MRQSSLVLLLFLGVLAACSSPERYESLAEAPFFFHVPGTSHSFVVQPRALSRTEVALESGGQALPIPDSGPPSPFSWVVTATAYQKGKAVDTIYLQPQAWWHADDQRHYKSVSLGSFDSLSMLPLRTEIVVRVVRSDPMFMSADPSLRVVVRASPIP